MLLGGTFGCALLFLAIKGVEWGSKVSHGIYPGSSRLMAGPPGESVFFSLYYLSTGLHGLHVLIGAILLAVVAARVEKGRITAGDHVWLENSALFWHLVDLLWIFLFALLYLVS